jgi:tRNA threonylcarbamoyladenosine biosynthesis protein TsaB
MGRASLWYFIDSALVLYFSRIEIITSALEVRSMSGSALLAIDTATPTISLALHDGQTLLGEHTWTGSENPTVDLAPAALELLARAGFTIHQLSALAVSIGPGTYADLRVGIAFAKGLAAGRGLPLVGVTTLDTIAAAQPHYQGSLIVTLRAGRGRIIVGRYQWKKGHWGSRGEPQLMDWPTLLASIDGTAYISGEIDEDGYAALNNAQTNEIPVSLIPPAYRLRRAGFLAEEAWSRLNSGGNHDFSAAKLQPIYLKPSEPT